MTIDETVLTDARSARDVLSDRQHDLELATAEYHHRIRQLYVAGGSLREIADALDLSHQRVHQIIDAAGFGIRAEDQPAKPPSAGEKLTCSFCGLNQTEVAKLIAGPGCYICGECVVDAGASADGEPDDRMTRVPDESKERCSFCRKRRRSVEAIVSGDNANICDECLELCREILREEGRSP